MNQSELSGLFDKLKEKHRDLKKLTSDKIAKQTLDIDHRNKKIEKLTEDCQQKAAHIEIQIMQAK